MKKIALNLYILYVSSLFVSELMAVCAVTCSYSGGRLGDNLTAYCHGRWVSYKYEIPFFYRTFPYSDQLMMHAVDEFETMGTFKQVIQFPKYGSKVKDLPIDKKGDTLYVIPYFSEGREERERLNFFHFDVDWHDKKFLALLRSEISPLKPIKTLDIPAVGIKLAIHVRRGGGFDKLYQQTFRGTLDADKQIPLKFPPDKFYIEQIKKVSEIFNNQPIYAYVFTDDQDPAELVNYYKRQVNKSNVTFDCRYSGNTHDQNVLEDFFSMMKFNCLIRPDSNFSIMAARLGHFKLVISPTRYKWVDSAKLEITEVMMELNENINYLPTDASDPF